MSCFSALKAVDYRRLALLSYFGNMFDKDGVQGQAISVDRPLEYFVPRIVYWKDVAVHVLHCKVRLYIVDRLLCSLVH